MTESVLQQLATKLGVAPEAAKRVVGMIAPALVGSLMNKAASPEGARVVRINHVTGFERQYRGYAAATRPWRRPAIVAGVRNAARNGVASEGRMNGLSNTVAAKTGVSVGATHALGGIVTTAMFGVLKHYFTRSGGNVGQLPTLLGHQLPMVKASMTEDIATALGLGGAGSFLTGVAAQMKAVSSHLEHPSTAGGSPRR